LTRIILGSPVHDTLHALYERGAVLGGTSAGAAIMSAIMITGDERLNRDSTNPFTAIRTGNVVTTRGLGFMQTVIIDQHFIKRKRHNRLISLVLENPSLIGVGIDEATAIIVSPDSTFRVAGEGTVMVLDPGRSSPVRTDRGGNLAASNILMHILKAGDVYDMRYRITTSASTAP
jgi:cyanophycinase